jgi:hypothetical protein
LIAGTARIRRQSNRPWSGPRPGSSGREEHSHDHRELVHVPSRIADPVKIVETDEGEAIPSGPENS